MKSETLRDAFRRWGYLQAEIDPFGRIEPVVHPDLEDATGEDAERLRAIYCGSIGAEFMHIHLADRARWVAERMERAAAEIDAERLLRRIADAEVFERFLHRRYVGSKRYSIEGVAALVPLLDAVLATSAAHGTRLALIGMSHRGRLNVMVNVVGRPARDLFAHYEDVDPRSVLGGGDVRYHLGATGRYETPAGEEVALHLVSNPSHLEAVDPVMMGRARARQRREGADGPRRVLPISIHGDAAFAGQGIAAETLNLDGLDGFSVGGTIHVVVNNLIGFTTTPKQLHGSRYATDVAKRLPVPIFHVNGEDPEVVARVGRIVADYRAEFGSDVVVDLVGFRRYGHSEVDDPTTTQPRLYREIEARPPLWRRYGKRLNKSDDDLEGLEQGIVARLTEARDAAKGTKEIPSFRRLPDYWDGYRGGPYEPEMEVDTAVDESRLREIAERVTSVPDGFHVHDKVKKGLDQRRAMAAAERPVDWGMAEALAFGSLLWEGTHVRLAGEDSRRGTFNHRHAALFDTESGDEHVPLAHLREGQASFEPLDTALSEAAALGYEYGFSRDYPEALVCWEAQFGDFANGAQIVIDQFVAAAEDKWKLWSGVVLLLPHGYEGQGPEHSSARPERFLQLAAEHNIQICQPTVAAQYFHLLRRQVLRTWRKPLVVLSPKSLLRADEAASPLSELTNGRFRPVLADDEAKDTRRVMLCTGRIAHELRRERRERERHDVAILALEQLYPFPKEELLAALQPHKSATEVLWVQDEPANMGALDFVRPRIQSIAGNRQLRSVKRAASASPATGSHEAHKLEQRTLMEVAFARTGA